MSLAPLSSYYKSVIEGANQTALSRNNSYERYSTKIFVDTGLNRNLGLDRRGILRTVPRVGVRLDRGEKS